MKERLRYTVTAAIVAAAYTGLTYLSNWFGLAYGPIQLRLSEALTVLPVFTPAAVPGLAIGCFFSNLASFNPIDLLLGTGATLVSALFSRAFRRVLRHGLPVLSALMPVIFNAVVVGGEIAFFLSEGPAALSGFWMAAGWVAIGEALACFGLGLPLSVAVRRNRFLCEMLR